jgi:dTMP kinase
MSRGAGRFITIEGGEGAGKSSNIAFIQTFLESKGIEILSTREPGGTPLGEEIRGLLLGHRHEEMGEDTELLLMFAARAQHIGQVIKPALDAGKWVVCDRFTDASYAYQGGGRGISMARIRMLEEWVQGALKPHLTLLLDLPVEVGMDRAGRRSTPDRFEKEETLFFERVRAAYLKIAQENPERMKIIDASVALDRVQHQIRNHLDSLLKRTGL